MNCVGYEVGDVSDKSAVMTQCLGSQLHTLKLFNATSEWIDETQSRNDFDLYVLWNWNWNWNWNN